MAPSYPHPSCCPLLPNDHSLSDLSGARKRDYWTVEQSVEFYKGTLEIDTELGLAGQVCHETHRSRSLFNPKSAIDILGRVPEYVTLPSREIRP